MDTAIWTTKTQVSAAVADDTYKQVLKEAARRGITVSELVRYFVEEGLNNPTPQELRRLSDRLTTIEGALKELYEMAVVNWSKVKKEKVIDAPLLDLPWLSGDWDNWKEGLKKRGLVDEKTGKTAYEKLSEAPDYDDPLSVWHDDDDDIQATLREMWKADGSWTEEEEKNYQEREREKLRENAGMTPKPVPQKRRRKKRKPGKPRGR
jgi:hypothetical protein